MMTYYVLGINDDYIYVNENDEYLIPDSFLTFDAAVLGAKQLASDSTIWKIDVEKREREDDRTTTVMVVFSGGMEKPMTMQNYCAVYLIVYATYTNCVGITGEPFVRFFSADDLDHAYDQAIDGRESGEFLVCVTAGDTRTWVESNV